MTLVLGTNCGFVTVAPTGDPLASSFKIDTRSFVLKHTSPSTAVKITEIGWYDDTAGTEEANFEVGLYDSDGADGIAGTRLFVDATNAKGTSGGWHAVTGLDWTITGDHIYWIGVQLDDTATQTDTYIATTGGEGLDLKTDTTLPDPYGGGALAGADDVAAIYAVWEAAAGGTATQINIADAWKSIAGMQINIGDSWKAVASAQINIGDAWKAVVFA